LGVDRWRILSYPGDKTNDNNHSCILQVDIAGKRILMPGDIDRRAEKLLVETYGEELKSDVLILAHHGSKSSSSDIWLEVVNPELGIVSSGFNNRFKHPHADVVNRFKQRFIPLYNTATSGAVEVDLSKTSSVIQWRKENPPVWRQM
jgi:competence protein ComEC